MSRIFVYGVPGVGKTHISNQMGKKLNLPVFEGDKIKSQLRKGKSKSEYPFLFLGTCNAYKEFGELNEENAVNGLHAVRNALQDAVIERAKNKGEIILEGAFLDPKELMKLGKPILVVVKDETRHKKQFLTHREKLLDIHRNEFKAARIIQDYLIKEAEELGFEIINND